MSSQSNKSVSWFARLGSALGGSSGGGARRQNRRGLRFESLETRSLLSATVLPTISGVVYEAPTITGLIATIRRWPTPRSTSFAMAATASSRARAPAATTRWSAPPVLPTAATNSIISPRALTSFSRSACRAWSFPSAKSVQTVVITSSDMQGTAGQTIDSFSSTSQYVAARSTPERRERRPHRPGGHRRPSQPVRAIPRPGAAFRWARFPISRPAGLRLQCGLQRHLLGQWDGINNNAAVLNPTGLGGVDITSKARVRASS